MQKIRLTERQLLMLQKLQEDKPKNRVLKINENQYNRLFKSAFNINDKVSKGVDKAGLDEGPKKEVDLSKFAQELIVFIKDMLSRPETAPFSKYWLELGLSKDKLIKMLEDEGLLTMTLDETDGVNKYVSEKQGFRRKVKECYKKINELGDAGYPAGAEFDSSAPWNQEDPEPEAEVEQGIKANKEIVKLIYYSEDMDGLCIFKKGNDLFVVTLESIITFKGEKLKPYLDGDQTFETADGETANNYINDKLAHKQIKAFSKNAPEGELALVTPELKQKLIGWYGEDKTLVGILNGVKETTGAASSGAYVGAASMGPIKKDMGNSPEKVMGELINDGVDASGIAEYHSQRSGEEPFVIDDIKWEYVNVINDGKVELGVYRFGQDICYTFDWFDKNVLHSMDETTSTVSVGGDSGTFAYDAPAGDGADFWTAGNKENKKGSKNPKGMPIVKGAIFTENIIKVGQVYKNGIARRKVIDIKNSNNPLSKKIIVVKQWGDKPSQTFNIDPKEWGHWELIHENKKKVLKITEAQLKRLLEANNQTSTAYPNGEMVDIDDCTKLNNNKVAQNGGCSQGAVDNVVKTTKTKDSVVSEGFNPNVGAGSVYAIEVKPHGARIFLQQDNGQVVVTHHDDIPELIKALKSVY